MNLQASGFRFMAADLPEANEMTVGIMAFVAEGERKAISKRTMEALAAARVRLANLTEDQRAERIARSKAVKLGAVRWDHLRDGVADRGRAAGIATRRAKASSRAADLAPIIADLQASGVTTLAGLAEAPTASGIPTARGAATWPPIQVSRVLAATLLNCRRGGRLARVRDPRQRHMLRASSPARVPAYGRPFRHV